MKPIQDLAAKQGSAIRAEDVTGDGQKDLVTQSVGTTNLLLFRNLGSGSFASVQTIAFTGSNLRSFDFADMNGDGLTDVVAYLGGDRTWHTRFGNGDGSFLAAVTSASGYTGADQNNFYLALGDLTGDGVPDVAANNRAFPTVALLYAHATTGSSTTGLQLSIDTQANARSALDTLGTVLQGHNSYVSTLGAARSRLETQYRVLDVRRENFLAAESRIRDADIGQEAADSIRLSILQQATSAVLAQANQQPNLALILLGR